MRVLVWGINYAPESTGIGPYNALLCEHLRNAGHDVEMVTAFPYYPSWRRRPEDAGVPWRTDIVRNIRVHRCWHYVPREANAWKRMLHEASFVLMSLLRVVSLRRADVVVVVSPPLMLGPAAWLASRLRRTGYVLHVQDLQPDAAVSLGMLRAGLFTRVLFGIEAWSYRHAWRLSGISKGMLHAFKEKGVPAEKLVYFPNGIELDAWPPAGGFRQRHGYSRDDFIVSYSGNLGVKQGLYVLMEVARLVRDSRIRFVICGDGADRARLVKLATHCESVRLLELLPTEQYRELMVDSDLVVIPQVPGSGRAFFPSKLLPALSAARPVLSIADADSELARAVQESGCGWNLPASAASEIVRLLEQLPPQSEELGRRGAAGRGWVAQFEESVVLSRFIRELESLVAES